MHQHHLANNKWLDELFVWPLSFSERNPFFTHKQLQHHCQRHHQRAPNKIQPQKCNILPEINVNNACLCHNLKRFIFI